jgi:formylglycine-generating enzyme required for sulfatase activity
VGEKGRREAWRPVISLLAAIPIGMRLIPAGTYQVGSNGGYPEERPIRKVRMSRFYMDETEVTCAQFAAFVKATGYVTLAERQPSQEMYPDADPSLLKPGSAVFVVGRDSDPARCWIYQPGASWRSGKAQEPVVHVAYEDALAYAKWAGKALATEDEYEVAARGGLVGKTYPWGDDERPKGRWMANVWQGDFPSRNSGSDGYPKLAPVRSFPPNGYGLFDMVGNVWEWTQSRGPGNTRITKGGSFLCAHSYCHRYRCAAKQDVTPDTSTEHIGFRCVWRPYRPPDSPSPTPSSHSGTDPRDERKGLRRV